MRNGRLPYTRVMAVNWAGLVGIGFLAIGAVFGEDALIKPQQHLMGPCFDQGAAWTVGTFYGSVHLLLACSTAVSPPPVVPPSLAKQRRTFSLSARLLPSSVRPDQLRPAAGWGLKGGALPLPYPCVLDVEPIEPEYLPHPSPLEVAPAGPCTHSASV